ncbi:14679_t:CDS:1 [Cetraspora pellucida]|uniref:14679_t:CDS:1 n=1 Tax=Cetraspora pellucida TaxID=1433469 RepID=A0A9N9I442_9GLOM|nr:14679_t:CDS:1 [Cetraspora pellucida]
MPTVKEIIDRLQELLNLGFNPTNEVILDILQLFENRLNHIGERIIHSFISIRRNETHDEFYRKIVGEAIKSERNLKKTEVLNFLDKMIGNKSKFIFMDAMLLFREKSSFRSIGGTKIINSVQPNSKINFHYYKPLLFNLTFYNWILVKFTENSEIANLAFNDILETRISLDICQNTKEFSSCKFIGAKFTEICNIFKVYCNIKNFFIVSHLELLKKVSHEDILRPLFEFYLLDIFDLPTTFKMPMQIADDDNIYVKFKRKRKKRIMIKEQKLEWLIAIENLHKEIVKKGNSITETMSTKFRNYIEDLYDILENEGFFEELQTELEMKNSLNIFKKIKL